MSIKELAIALAEKPNDVEINFALAEAFVPSIGTLMM